MDRENFIKEVTEIITEVYDAIESDKCELDKYKKLYNDECNHTKDLQRLVDRLGAQLDKQTFRKEVNKYFQQRKNDTTEFNKIDVQLNDFLTRFFYCFNG